MEADSTTSGFTEVSNEQNAYNDMSLSEWINTQLSYEESTASFLISYNF